MPPCPPSVSCSCLRQPAVLYDFPLLLTMHDLPGEIDVRHRGVGAGLVDRDGHSRGGRLTDLHGLPNDRLEDLVVREIAQRIEHVATQDRAAVIEGGEEAQHLEFWVEPRLHGP